MKLHLQIPLSHSAYEWLRSQADKVGASGHIGTHMDCYTTMPSQVEYIVECVVIDYLDLNALNFKEIDLSKKALIIYSGNLENNQYGTEKYNTIDTSINTIQLENILQSNPQFILIDSHGIGTHGKQHIANDILCEQSNCFVIENVNLKKDSLISIKNIEIVIDLNNQSTGKPCEITCLA